MTRPKTPRAERIAHTPGVRTVWHIKWPSTPRKWGKVYRATTYPDGDGIFLETAAKQRPVSELVGRRILPQVRAALVEAGAWRS